MYRLGLLALALLINTGCRVCDAPYDYDGPVVPCGSSGCGGGCSSCGTSAAPMMEYEAQPTPAPTQPYLIPQSKNQPTPAPSAMAKREQVTRSVYQGPDYSSAGQPLPPAARQAQRPMTKSKGPIVW
jgi:hypothetical protein